MIGQTVGNYRILDKMGEGGMGAVYRAEHALIGKRAAVKVLLPDVSRDPELVQRFFNEARAATSIHHPGIVEVFDYGHHADGSAYIVMELLAGESLAARLRRSRLHPAPAVRLLRQVARALAAAHALGIVHRDLKPDNVFVVPDPEVTGGERIKILDFGIAKLADAAQAGVRTRTGSVIGTPIYMAPEQCRGNVEVDHRADLYALGVMFFEMLCGRPPFRSTGLGELFAEHMFSPPPPPRTLEPAIPAAVEAIVLRLLAKEPGARYQRADELVGALDAVDALAAAAPPPAGAPLPGPALAQPSPPPVRASPPPGYASSPPPARKTNLWLVVGLPVGAGVLVIGVVIFLVAKQSTGAYTSYLQKSKRSEADLQLGSLRKAAEQYRLELGTYPVGAAGPTPSLGECCNHGGTCPPSPSQWTEDPIWQALDFVIDEPHHFSYQYESGPDGTDYTVRANADLDCDSIYSTYEMTGAIGTVTRIRDSE